MEKIKLLLYCTKQKPYLLRDIFCGFLTEKNFEVYDDNEKKEDYFLNGKIVGECDFEVEEIRGEIKVYSICDCGWISPSKHDWCYSKDLLDKSCLTNDMLCDYLDGNTGYAIHIKNLNIFDEPRELSEYSKRIGNDFQVLGNAPQNMMKCCETKYIIENYILISIRPEWLCKILNGEKTIECRKRILKEMISK